MVDLLRLLLVLVITVVCIYEECWSKQDVFPGAQVGTSGWYDPLLGKGVIIC